MGRYFFTPAELAQRSPFGDPPEHFTKYSGPKLTPEILNVAETVLGIKLPTAYIDLLHESNGGFLKKCRLMSPLLNEEVEAVHIAGIGYPDGLDGATGSMYMTREWNYPEGLIWFSGDGHTGFFFDFGTSDGNSDPPIVWYDTEEEPPLAVTVASDFKDFLDRLY